MIFFSQKNVLLLDLMYLGMDLTNLVKEKNHYHVGLVGFFLGHNLLYFGDWVAGMDAQFLQRVSLASFENGGSFGVAEG